MTHGKHPGIHCKSFLVLGVLAGILSIAWGEDREERGEEREGRGKRNAARKIYKEIPPAVPRPNISFEKDVKPILLENCTRCHGAKKHKGHLRLDTPEGILAGTEDDAVIKPGKGAESLLVRAITGIGVESEDVMPPKEELLSKEEIGIIRAWIDQGAKFK